MCLAAFILGYLCFLFNFLSGISKKWYEEEQMTAIPVWDLVEDTVVAISCHTGQMWSGSLESNFLCSEAIAQTWELIVKFPIKLPEAIGRHWRGKIS